MPSFVPSFPAAVFGVTFKKITANLFENFAICKAPRFDRAHVLEGASGTKSQQ